MGRVKMNKITILPGTIKITKEDTVEYYKKQYLDLGLSEEKSTLLAEYMHQKIMDNLKKSKE